MKDKTRQENHPKLEIRKYQNRRYYDTTNSQHLSMEQIHRKICEGYDIRVVDAKTDEDITAKVLTQILLEYEPKKLDFLSSDLLTQVIRVNDTLLKDFYDVYFGKAFSLFMDSKSNFEKLLRQSHALPGYGKPFDPTLPIASVMEAFNPFGSILRPERPEPSPRDLAKELDAMRQQIEDLKKQTSA
ncbi:PHB/PHA accumulation regulator DNA-binding domain protein [Verrucomicrobiia bacterium DG1235]|nr:PHB/PHA accumulation regulator DNA-binding domain protein [Verrucomicrobiae bacterium DG1235]